MLGRVFMVSELYHPEETSTGYFVTGIAEEVAKQFPITVVCAQPTYSERGRIASWRERYRGVDILRCWSTRFDKDVFVLRFFNLVTFCATASARLLARVGPHDTVIAVTNPPTLPILAALLSRWKGARFVLLVHDVYPEVLVVSGLLARKGWAVRLIGRVFDWVLNSANRIVVIGRDMQTLFERKVESADVRLALIPNWADLDEVTPQSRSANTLLRDLGLADKFVVQFAGNMGRTHDPNVLLDAAGRLRGDLRIHFLFVGNGARFQAIEERVRRDNLQNVTVLGRQKRDSLATMLGACDLAVIAFLPGMAGVSVPSRIYNILAAGRPLLAVADDQSEAARLVREKSIGWAVRPGDSDGVIAAIREAASEPWRLADMGRRARAVVESEYSLGLAGERYRSLLQETLGRSS